MDFSKATILVTGGNSGIGRGLAEALASKGAKVIITGRNVNSLRSTLAQNHGIMGETLDVTDANSLESFAKGIVLQHPTLNAVIHCAGIMESEDALADPFDLDVAKRTISTNLLAPICLTGYLLPHLRSKDEAAVVTVSSGLAFVPRAENPTYCATKAAIHSWSTSLRHQLQGTTVSVVELVPPLVATGLTPGQGSNPRAMPLQEFVDETVKLLCAENTPFEVVVQRAVPQRTAEQTGNFEKIFGMINGT